jgi:hypothetical protein
MVTAEPAAGRAFEKPAVDTVTASEDIAQMAIVETYVLAAFVVVAVDNYLQVADSYIFLFSVINIIFYSI